MQEEGNRMNISQPIIKKIEDTRNALDFFEKEILLLEDKRHRKLLKIFLQFIFIIGRISGNLRFISGNRIIFSGEHVNTLIWPRIIQRDGRENF